MSKTIGYSIWLMPTEDIYNRLNSFISQLSKKYNTPNFEPHVTLIGEVLGSEEEILSKTSQLASVVRPYKIELGKIEYFNAYFRCLFLRAKQTVEVMNANLKARKLFGRQNELKYMPHLSLMYGNFSSQTKERIIAEIGREMSTVSIYFLQEVYQKIGIE